MAQVEQYTEFHFTNTNFVCIFIVRHRLTYCNNIYSFIEISDEFWNNSIIKLMVTQNQSIHQGTPHLCLLQKWPLTTKIKITYLLVLAGGIWSFTHASPIVHIVECKNAQLMFTEQTRLQIMAQRQIPSATWFRMACELRVFTCVNGWKTSRE